MPQAPDALDLLQPEDPVGEECGVFGVWAPGEDVAKLTYYGLYALQHRGQESAGIAASDGRRLLVYKDMGLVSQVFDENTLESFQGHIAIGHARYSTTGASTWQNAQPTFRPTADGSIALGHNGNLINTHDLARFVDELPDPLTPWRPPAVDVRSPALPHGPVDGGEHVAVPGGVIDRALAGRLAGFGRELVVTPWSGVLVPEAGR